MRRAGASVEPRPTSWATTTASAAGLNADIGSARLPARTSGVPDPRRQLGLSSSTRSCTAVDHVNRDPARAGRLHRPELVRRRRPWPPGSPASARIQDPYADDVRDAPALNVAEWPHLTGAEVVVVTDPRAVDEPSRPPAAGLDRHPVEKAVEGGPTRRRSSPVARVRRPGRRGDRHAHSQTKDPRQARTRSTRHAGRGRLGALRCLGRPHQGGSTCCRGVVTAVGPVLLGGTIFLANLDPVLEPSSRSPSAPTCCCSYLLGLERARPGGRRGRHVLRAIGRAGRTDRGAHDLRPFLVLGMVMLVPTMSSPGAARLPIIYTVGATRPPRLGLLG